jgi:hypothetical protein
MEESKLGMCFKVYFSCEYIISQIKISKKIVKNRIKIECVSRILTEILFGGRFI